MKYRDFVASSDIPIALAGRALASHYRPEPGGSPFLYPFPFVNQFTTEPGIKKTVAFATAFLACGEGGS